MFDSLFGILPLPLRVLIQLVDYLIKAGANWRETAEGAKEWSDFTDLYEQMLNNSAEGGVEYGVEDREQIQREPAVKINTAKVSRGAVQYPPKDFDYAARSGDK